MNTQQWIGGSHSSGSTGVISPESTILTCAFVLPLCGGRPVRGCSQRQRAPAAPFRAKDAPGAPHRLDGGHNVHPLQHAAKHHLGSARINGERTAGEGRAVSARTCFPSSHDVLMVVMKNWLPLVSGPELAMDRSPPAECLILKFSSLNLGP